jgi:hypothetical protein
MLWDAPQLIKFISINHNMYLSFCKSLGQKIGMNKTKNKSSFQAMRLDKMCIQNIFKNNITIVSYIGKKC